MYTKISLNLHYFLVFLSFLTVSLTFVFNASAQTGAGKSAVSNQVITRVGNAPLDQKPGGNFVYYCQADPQWQSSGCRIDIAGCGPSSMAMIVSSLGLTENPMQMDQIFRGPPQVRACGDAASDINSFIASNWLQNNGFEVQAVPRGGVGLDLKAAQNYLASGYYIIASSHSFPCPPQGFCRNPDATVDHVFTIFATNEANNTFSVHDPLNCTPSNPAEQPSGIVKPNNFPLLLAWAIRKK